MGLYDGGSGKSGSKLALKEFSAFFVILLVIVGAFSLITYKYNSKVDVITDGILSKSGASYLAANEAEEKAKVISTEIEIAKSNVARVNDLLRQEKINLKEAKRSAIAEVAELEKELALIDINVKRVEGLLSKEREVLADKKAAAITEVAEKEAELKAEHERVEALYKEEIARLDEKKAKAIALVAEKEADVAGSEQKVEADTAKPGDEVTKDSLGAGQSTTIKLGIKEEQNEGEPAAEVEVEPSPSDTNSIASKGSSDSIKTNLLDGAVSTVPEGEFDVDVETAVVGEAFFELILMIAGTIFSMALVAVIATKLRD